MKELTNRQKEILKMISSFIEKSGFPPTRIEICEALGFRSPNAAEEHLKALEKKGALSLVAGTSRSIKLNNFDSVDSTQSNLLPLVGTVSAGSPIQAIEHIETQFKIDTKMFPSQPDYLLRIKGMSMRDAGIIEDDLLVVKKYNPNSTIDKNDQIVVARVEDEVTVKRFRQKGSIVYLHPENPEFKTISIDLKKQFFKIEGLGIGVIRNPKNYL
ncbi:MAG: repressor LexA [Betaproteobacteria bacterium TMED41]|nr:MAG: repressor LexA [Betaproteobacteria bacterium TMED41]|tara:strand:- start:32 stop:673 length:642 start_codon:yes stop_codon:yes gene_type:complete